MAAARIIIYLWLEKFLYVKDLVSWINNYTLRDQLKRQAVVFA